MTGCGKPNQMGNGNHKKITKYSFRFPKIRNERKDSIFFMGNSEGQIPSFNFWLQNSNFVSSLYFDQQIIN